MYTDDTYIHTGLCGYIHNCVYVHMCICVCVYVCMCIVYVCMYICVVYMCTCVHVYVYMCVCVCLHVHSYFAGALSGGSVRVDQECDFIVYMSAAIPSIARTLSVNNPLNHPAELLLDSFICACFFLLPFLFPNARVSLTCPP